jgi:triacylglycerol lipase
MSDSRTRARSGGVAVVFVHGYLCLHPALYWAGTRRLRRQLRARGATVVLSRQASTAPVVERARQLAARLERLPHARIVLVGHSMGGLDARYVASRLDPQSRVSHVLTIGTPHCGTPVALKALREPVWTARLARLVDRGALADLTPEGAARLRELAPDRPDVVYRSIAGTRALSALPGALRWIGEAVAEDAGANDGVVPLVSAGWGQLVDTLEADHVGLVGGLDAAGSLRRAHPRVLRALGELLPSRPGEVRPA